MPTQYQKPIGPSRPIGIDTRGNYVFPDTVDTGQREPYRPPTWFDSNRGGSGGSGQYGGGAGSSGRQLTYAEAYDLRKAAEEQASMEAARKAAQQASQEAARDAASKSAQQKIVQRAGYIKSQQSQAGNFLTNSEANAIARAEIIRESGRAYSRVQYQRELGKGGVSSLRSGTKKEAAYHKETKLSLSEMRQELTRAREAPKIAAVPAKLRMESLETIYTPKPSPKQDRFSVYNVIDKPINWVSEKVESVFPEGRLKNFLFTPRSYLPPPSEIVMFSAFSPWMATTSEATAFAIKTGKITPITETEFKAVVRPVKSKGNAAEINLIAKSETGGTTTLTVSRQIAIDTGELTNVGAGRVYSVTRVRKGVSDIISRDIYGGSKNIGTATINRDIAGAKISKDIGEGIFSRSFSKETAGKRINEGLRILYPKYFNLKITKGYSSQDLYGALAKSSIEDVYGYAGTSAKTTTVISKYGISKRIPYINIKGRIKFIESPSDFFTGGTTEQLTKTVKTETLSRVLRTVSAGQLQAEKIVIKDISRTKIVTKSSPVSFDSQAMAPQKPELKTADINLKLNLGTVKTSAPELAKELSLPKTSLSFASGSSVKEKERERFKTKQKLETEQIDKLRSLLSSDTKQRQEQRYKTRLVQKVKFEQKTKQKNILPINLRLRYKPGWKVILGAKTSPKNLYGSKEKYPVFARRFGKFKLVGYGETPEEAIYKGAQYSRRTLGRSFYAPGSAALKLPGFRLKKEKGRQIYVQKTGKGAVSTLGTSGEKMEIQSFRSLKMPRYKQQKYRGMSSGRRAKRKKN